MPEAMLMMVITILTTMPTTILKTVYPPIIVPANPLASKPFLKDFIPFAKPNTEKISDKTDIQERHAPIIESFKAFFGFHNC